MVFFGIEVVRPERFELPTNWFEASCSIQLSYRRTVPLYYTDLPITVLEECVTLKHSIQESYCGNIPADRVCKLSTV